jgi:hypothetical protein
MPGGDGTGPTGMGPMTGRAAGYCAGYSVPGYANWGFGPGRGGRGRGRGGRGWRHRFYATGLPGWARGGAPFAPPAPPAWWSAPAPEGELDALRRQAEYFEESLAGIRSRIAELEKAGDEQT